MTQVSQAAFSSMTRSSSRGAIEPSMTTGGGGAGAGDVVGVEGACRASCVSVGGGGAGGASARGSRGAMEPAASTPGGGAGAGAGMGMGVDGACCVPVGVGVGVGVGGSGRANTMSSSVWSALGSVSKIRSVFEVQIEVMMC